MFPLRAGPPIEAFACVQEIVLFNTGPCVPAFKLPLPKIPVAWFWVVADSTAASAIALWQV